MSYAEVAESEAGGTCPALFEAAHPEAYGRNPFRVAGLSVEASARDIARQAEKLRMMQKFTAVTAPRTPLALNPPPDEYAVRDALHRLNDPERRLVDEFFWFWPRQLGQSKLDPALALLAKDDIHQAARIWLQTEQSSESHVSQHNLAVLFHCLALDMEQVALQRTLNDEERRTVQGYWDHAFKRWKVVLHHEPFWSRLSARIRALEDPRLTTGLSRRMRESLPLALLSINANLAVRFAEAGKMAGARRHLEVMKLWEASGVGHGAQEVGGKSKGAAPAPPAVLGPLAREALKQAVEPIRQRIRSICKNAEAQADADPVHGDRATKEVLERTKPLLAILDNLLPPGDATRDAARDEVAASVLQCQIPFGNKTENWRVSLQLLELALPLAATQAMQDRIQDNINTVKNNLEYCTCWFCKQNPADDKAALDVKVFGDVTRTPTYTGVQIQWRYGTVKVPRCSTCKSAHSKQGTSQVLGAVLGFVLGFGGCVVAASQDAPGWGFLLLLVLGGIGCGVGAAIGRPRAGVKPESAKGEFPSVKKLIGQGWQYGERPHTQ